MAELRSWILLLGALLTWPAAAGSLIDPAHYRGLAADRSAAVVGDLLTVVVLESATASASATTGTESRSEATLLGSDGHGQVDLRGGLRGSGEAAGRTLRSGLFRAQIATTVTAVVAPGVLSIAGTQDISINGEVQTIRLTGTVRTLDIDADNTVLSSRIADAHIALVGVGSVDQGQRRGLLIRLMKWLRLL